MHLFLIGFNHKTTPAEIREQIAMEDQDLLAGALNHLLNIRHVLGTAILSTCNRTEIYTSVEIQGSEAEPLDEPSVDMLKHSVLNFLANYQNTPLETLQKHAYVLHCGEAVRHSFRVAASLDSLVVGERQILSQYKTAYHTAAEAQATDSLLNRLFQSGIAVGKKVRSDTALGTGAVSVSQAAVELAQEIFEDLSRQRALIVGAGETAGLAALHLHSRGVSSMTFINRSLDKAQHLAQKYEGQAHPWEELEAQIQHHDIIFSATSAPEPIITQEMVQQALRLRKNKALLLMDMAIPRDIDPAVDRFDPVYLYGVDDLKTVVDKNLNRRKKEIPKAEKIIQEEFERYLEWYSKLNIQPVIKEIKNNLEVLRQNTIKQFAKKANKGNQEIDIQLVDKITAKFLDKIIRELMSSSENLHSAKDWQEYSHKLKDIFHVGRR